jgi:uncharacterized glyoxalase superfamily protein PhnB
VTDPFEALRQRDAPLRPRPAFAADLGRRLTAALAQHSSEEETVPSRTRIHRVETYLSVSDPRAAISFYEEAFGATLIDEPVIMPDGRIGHCELAIGDSVVRVGGEHPAEAVHNPDSLGGTTVQLYAMVDDADAVVDRARSAGAEVLRPVADAHGTRMGKVRDPFGHNWFVVSEVPAPHPNARPATGALGYFTLSAPDGARARAFWSSLFAWDLVQGPEGYHIANIEPPGGIHAGTPVPGTGLFFRVDDIEFAVERVRALGGSAGEVHRRRAGSDAECTDDQGIPFQLWSPAPGY